MSKTVQTADDVNGDVSCPCCDEELGESKIEVAGRRGGASPTRVRGGVGGVWVLTVVECGECGEQFEIGGPAGVTELPENV
ncbi:hypothetical protein HRTV-18_gp94 [Halorubrum virus HRTV-18]|nr:hypothetical protein HRTV-18_gp94 [Halorubrum virus HRTV-18]UBF19926.1 hypothetical protein HRTV-20_gp94 [Halorubrum virus HRTV-20]